MTSCSEPEFSCSYTLLQCASGGGTVISESEKVGFVFDKFERDTLRQSGVSIREAIRSRECV
jgi:hypothetical protein